MRGPSSACKNAWKAEMNWRSARETMPRCVHAVGEGVAQATVAIETPKAGWRNGLLRTRAKLAKRKGEGSRLAVMCIA